MTIDIHRRTDCRLCRSTALELVLALTPTPLANAFVPEHERGREQQCFPLDVHQCHDCGHVQLLDVVDPKALFSDYVYVAGTSPVFVDHFRRYATKMIDVYGLPSDSLVVDIGSNDGTLLGFFQDAGMRVLGVDPAKNITRRAIEAGIETRAMFFTPALAREILAEYGAASLVTANNVFAHTDDLSAIVEGAKLLLAPDGLFVFEVSYLADVFEKTLFDTIYHEHLSYHTVAPLRRFFAGLSMEIVNAEHIDSHGGSIRVTVQKASGQRMIQPAVDLFIAHENRLGLNEPKTLRAFSDRIRNVGAELVGLLNKLAGEGKRIAAYGAPAKATTLAYHFDLGPEIISFIVDDSPLKQGLYSPGKHIPVLPPAALVEQNVDFAVVLAWNFVDSIIHNSVAYRRTGGRFVVPLPKVKVI